MGLWSGVVVFGSGQVDGFGLHWDGTPWRIEKAQDSACNAKSIGALEGSDGILEVVGNLRVIGGPILEVGGSSVGC